MNAVAVVTDSTAYLPEGVAETSAVSVVPLHVVLGNRTGTEGADVSVTVADGALRLPVTQGDIDGSNTGPISYAGQPVPDGDWQIETKITLDPDNEWQHAGLAQIVDDTFDWDVTDRAVQRVGQIAQPGPGR